MRCTAAGQPHGVLSCSCFQETNWWLQRGRGGTGGIERQKGPGGGFRLPMHVPGVGAIQRCMGTTSPSHSASLMTHVARGFPSKHTCKAPLPVPKQGGGLLDAASGLCFFFHLAFGTKPGPEIFLSVTVAFTVPSWRKQGPRSTCHLALYPGGCAALLSFLQKPVVPTRLLWMGMSAKRAAASLWERAMDQPLTKKISCRQMPALWELLHSYEYEFILGIPTFSGKDGGVKGGPWMENTPPMSWSCKQNFSFQNQAKK